MDGLKATRLQDVIDDVTKAKAHYDRKKGDSKLYKRIISFSKRVAYYGKVLDVMVQHHPEYVSLAWGSLKLIFGVSTPLDFSYHTTDTFNRLSLSMKDSDLLSSLH